MGISGIDLTGKPVLPGNGGTKPAGDGKTGDQASEEKLTMPNLGAFTLEELESLEKLSHAAAAQKLLDAAIKKNNETLLAVGEERGERTGAAKSGAPERQPERSTDEASLSRDSLVSVMKEEDAAVLKSQLEESLQLNMEKLESWMPSGFKPLESELAQLKEIYNGIAAEILENLPKDMQDIQAQRLNLNMVEALQRLSEGKYPNLIDMLNQAGEKELANILQAAVFRQVTGRSVSPEAFGVYGNRSGNQQYINNGRQTDVRGGEGRSFLDAPGKGTHPRGRETGVLYSKGASRGVYTDVRYQEQVRRTERFTLKLAGEHDPLLETFGGRDARGKLYTAADIERAEQFSGYFRNGGNLMESPALTARNEELLGFLMAQNMMKAEIFSEYAGVGKEMGKNIRDILEKLSRYYLGRAQEECAREEAGAAAARFDGKAVRKIFYQVMQLFHRTKKPRQTLEEGLRQAVEEYCSKKEKAEYKKKKRYKEDAGFFERTVFGKSRRRQWEDARRELEKDWEDFLKSIGQQGNELLQLVFSAYSPWGAQLEPEEAQTEKKASHPAVLVLIAAAVVVFLMMLILR